ncbi:MAG: ribosome biogenesis GTPase Der [Kiritimatiellae bacterium]|nr:ribosome biogenesis GTPase Der [Kiritimatiellia bacterium]
MSRDPQAPASGSIQSDTRRRVVAIAGRPNVGKSAIFNRIAGRRVAIVHDESGVTRDRLVREVAWGEERFELIDTGGVQLLGGESAADTIGAGVRAQVQAALEDAAAVILAVDAQQGLHPMDAEVARMVRRSGCPCFVAVNKCDLPQHDGAASEFAALGFPLYAVSAQHNRGFDALMHAVTARLPAAPNETIEHPLKVAVVGRPNAGKSSYINRLLRAPRVIVSEVAGTTRDSIEVPFSIGAGPQARHYRLIDTAGMRHVHRIDSAVERFSLFRAERSVAEADVVVLVLDATVGPAVQDKHIAALIQRELKGCVMVVNKWDLAIAQGVTQTRYEPALRAAMPFMAHCPLVFVSAQSGYNIRASVAVIDEVAAQTRATLSTGLLNRVLADATARVQPPGAGSRRMKIYYAAQTGTAPLSLRLFVNDTALATSNYTDYLVRALRAHFGLAGAPIVIRYRQRVRPDEHATRHAGPAPAGKPRRSWRGR